jgi:hypothetical protein
MSSEVGLKVFGNPARNAPRREFRPDIAEPRLFPEAESRPIDPPFITHAGMLSATRNEERIPVTLPTISAPGERFAGADRFRASTWRYLLVVGLGGAATVGALFGTGFLSLAPPEKPIAAFEPNSAHPDAARADRGPDPVLLKSETSPTATVAAIPGASRVQHPVADKATPVPRSKAASAPLPGSAGSERPETPPAHDSADKPEPASSSPVSAVASKSLATPPRSSSEDAPSHRATTLPTRNERRDYARITLRHSHLKSARNGRSPAPRRPRAAQSAAVPQRQIGSFDQLLTRLAGGGPKPVGQSLTPPPADQQDPFTPRVSDR